jgi:Tol biopolymer transport system component
MTEPIPDETSRKRTWLIAIVLSVVVLLVGVGVAFGVMAMRRPTTPRADISAIESTSSVSALPTGSPAATSSPNTSATSPSTTPTPTPASSSTQVVRAGRVAYRFSGAIWVADENGSNPKQVIASTNDEFSLSPDGKTLVVMASTGGGARLIDVNSLAIYAVPAAVKPLPAWSPDSSWIAYTAYDSTGYSVRRVNRDATGDTLIHAGAAPVVSADGTRIAFTATPHVSTEGTDPIQVLDLSTPTKTQQVKNSAGATYYAYASSGTLFFVVQHSARWELWSADSHLSTRRVATVSTSLTGVAPQPQAQPGPLIPSPDGSKIAFAIVGDESSSTVCVATVSSGAVKALLPPADVQMSRTPVQWLLDGSAILFVEGNADQGEATNLDRMKPDGSGKVVVKKGAGV